VYICTAIALILKLICPQVDLLKPDTRDKQIEKTKKKLAKVFAKVILPGLHRPPCWPSHPVTTPINLMFVLPINLMFVLPASHPASLTWLTHLTAVPGLARQSFHRPKW
jgi:hypothetical protein